MCNVDLFGNFKFSKEGIYTITNKNFKRDLDDARNIIKETDTFLRDENNSEEEKCDKLYSVLKCYGKNIYERVTELYLAVESSYSIESKRNRDLFEIAKIIDFDDKEFESFPYNVNFIKDKKLDNIHKYYKKDNKDYTMTEFAGPKDKTFIFIINALQHGNSYLNDLIINENFVFIENYEIMKDLFLQMDRYVERVWDFINSKLEVLPDFESKFLLMDADRLYNYISK
ncbi:hypothetical protein B5F20_09615 [Clostridium perfringens]|uniref:hypothetical protein n=1 Tax=Clostridium perfringens TaxID=1502 RepID=UPI000B36F1C4|nr:hypothetical protein [Clostridium perfringens]OUP46217.1 hypothetical protein B5F20_09615 [Clostridium perfringens]